MLENQTSLVATLGEINQGKDLAEIDNSLRELLESVKQNGGKGNITVKLTVEFVKALDNGVAQLAMMAECKVVQPKIKVLPTTFFADETNALTRSDPNQRHLWEEQDKVRPMARKEAN